MLGGFTYFVNVSCSCAASISSVLLSSPKKEHQLNLSAETLTMLFLLIHIEPVLNCHLFLGNAGCSFFHPVNILPMVSIGSCYPTIQKAETHIDQPSIGLDYQTSLFLIFPRLS